MVVSLRNGALATSGDGKRYLLKTAFTIATFSILKRVALLQKHPAQTLRFPIGLFVNILCLMYSKSGGFGM